MDDTGARWGGGDVDEQLLQLLDERYGLAALDRHAGAIYAVSADWTLRYVNRAWATFACANGGDPARFSQYVCGSSMLDALADAALRDFYALHYNECRTSGRVWRHEYDCSAPDVIRRYQQLAYPLPDGALLIVNSRLVEMPAGASLAGDLDVSCAYRDAHGLVHQCAHCRRVSLVADDSCWDWVPAWAADIPVSASHTFCPLCAGFYYQRPRPR